MFSFQVIFPKLLIRLKKPLLESFGKSFSYALQPHYMIPTPIFKTTSHEKWFLGFTYIQSFFACTIYLTLFSTQLISPEIKFMTDEEIRLEEGNAPEPINDFGIGESCLYELRQGKKDKCIFI